MNNILKHVKEEWNKTADSDWYLSYRTNEVIQKILNDPEIVFYKQTWDTIKSTFPDIKGKKICIPFSGNNHAAFAFAVLGAMVTTCDISDKQITYAQKDRKVNPNAALPQ